MAWGRRTTQASLVGGCSGTVLRTGNTPGTWTYDWIHNFDNVYSFGPSGASYIRLSPRLPPGQAEADWLHVEGMKALVWGGGKWITGGASGMLDRRRKDAGLMPRPQISNNRAFYKGGQFYASPPPAARFPDLITVNGTMYTAVGTNGTVYNDAAGKLLDVNTLGS